MWQQNARSNQRAKQRAKRERIPTGEDIPELDFNESPWETILCEMYDELARVEDDDERFEEILSEADSSLAKAAGVDLNGDEEAAESPNVEGSDNETDSKRRKREPEYDEMDAEERREEPDSEPTGRPPGYLPFPLPGFDVSGCFEIPSGVETPAEICRIGYERGFVIGTELRDRMQARRNVDGDEPDGEEEVSGDDDDEPGEEADEVDASDQDNEDNGDELVIDENEEQ